MFKKIVLMLSALIILSLPYQQQYVEGAILSKVASKGAQKIVKEVIKESAFDYAVNIFLDEAFTMALEERQKYQAQQDYEIFCGKKMPDLITCEKPMQVKADLTPEDKSRIGQQAEIELDKLITNGKGLTRWQKFMDWFLPIWITSFALTAITYLLDPEVKSLFDEAGYNALVALGIIKPVYSNVEFEPIEQTKTNLPVPEPTQNDSILEFYTSTQNIRHFSFQKTLDAPIPFKNLVIHANQSAEAQWNASTLQLTQFGVINQIYSWQTGTLQIGKKFHTDIATNYEATFLLNGEILETKIGVDNTEFIQFSYPVGISAHTQKMKSIMYRAPYEIGGFYYTDILFDTVDGNIITVQIRAQQDTQLSSFSYFNLTSSSTVTSNKTMNVAFHKNQIPNKKVIPPLYEDMQTDMAEQKSKYENDKGEIALIPPSALPYTQTSTGIQLTPETDPNTGEQKFTTPSGESIPEDDITVGEPNVQDNPSPSPNTVTPPATQTNPNPEPIPLTPSTPTTPPPNTPTPVETLPPVFPEGESCDVGLKLPKFNPLMHTISDAFPFSIPFDLKDGFDAIFAEMGNEKPEFDYKFNFMGDEQSWKITIPDYFDSWKAFTDSFLIFIFDVGIIYAIYRFMGGGN